MTAQPEKRPASNTVFGPVSATLEHELRQLVRRRDIVIWLDADETYNGFVDALREQHAAGNLPYAVKAFRGSHLELLMELESLTSTSTRHPLVVHMPTFKSETITQTPLLELYLAGTNFRKRLTTLIREAATGKVLPARLEEFCGRRDLTLAEADAWLAAMLREGSSSLSGVLRMVPVELLIDDLLTKPISPGSISSQIHSNADRAAVWDRLSMALGIPATWHDTSFVRKSNGVTKSREQQHEDIAFNAASWAMAVEYVDDLRRPPNDPKLAPAVGLARPLVDACQSLATHLRVRHPSFYTQTADDTERELDVEVGSAQPADLGKVDTFRFEEETILIGSLEALERGDWDSAKAWSTLRIEGASFWLAQEPERQNMWSLIRHAATLGQSIRQAGPTLGRLDSHETAIKRYTDAGAAVDRAHRELEQSRRSLLYPRLTQFERLRDCLDAMRDDWREWADAWAKDFNQLCREQGFLPPAKLQQRNLFNDVVVPLVSDEDAIAIFLIDAFRFEMAQELFATVADAKATTSHLVGRLAELPTITAVGMNALAPVARGGRMAPDVKNGKFGGFSTGQYRVHDAETRKRAMHEKVGGRTCPRLSLREVMERDSKGLKRVIAQARLIFVHGQEIDDAGEKDLGPVVFEHAMQNIKAAWRLLREAGVNQFVFTADHGFLLRDGVKDVRPHGSKVDPTRRHVVSEFAADHKGEVRVPLVDLGYDGCDERLQLMFPETTAAFDIGDRSMSFLHGGNSLQERLIPVITISHRTKIGGSPQKYELTGKALDPVGGMHCLQATLLPATGQSTLDFGAACNLDLSLRVKDDAEHVTLEICQVRGGDAKQKGSTVAAVLGEPFELFFRIHGEADARVQVELYHPGAEANVRPFAIESRFTVTVTRGSAKASEQPVVTSKAWLDELPDEGVRQMFRHLAQHGIVTETEAIHLLGGSRKMRRFSSEFESLAKIAPFGIRIDVVGGVKRYVRERESEYQTKKDRSGE
jgi:hypothetical protein